MCLAEEPQRGDADEGRTVTPRSRVKHSTTEPLSSRTICKFFNLDQWFRRFFIWRSGGPPVWWSGTIYAILKKGIMGNIHVKLYEIWTSGSGDVV